MEVASATNPCNSNPCVGQTVCSVNRDCLTGDSLCVPYTCLPSCDLGGGQVLKLHKTPLSLQVVERVHALLSAELDQHCYGYVNKTESETEGCVYEKEAGDQYCENPKLVCSYQGQSFGKLYG